MDDNIRSEVDTEKIMKVGMETFAKASKYLENLSKKAVLGMGPVGDIPMMIPSIVLGALACEVGLKTLLRIEGKTDERKHELKVLYQKLDECHKSEISQKLLVSMKEIDENYNEENLDEDLDEVNKAFVDWRYFYEKSQHTSIAFLNEFYKSIQMTICSTDQESD